MDYSSHTPPEDLSTPPDQRSAGAAGDRAPAAPPRRRERRAAIDPACLPEIITADEAAALLRVNPTTVRELFHAGVLPGRKLGPKILRFHRDELLRWVRGKGCVSQTPRRPG
jgi:excisionase family DNA binding protein